VIDHLCSGGDPCADCEHWARCDTRRGCPAGEAWEEAERLYEAAQPAPPVGQLELWGPGRAP